MSDKELIRLAAKAAGIELYEISGTFYFHYVDARGAYAHWNPLRNDTLALELASKLFISIRFSLFAVTARSIDLTVEVHERLDNDPHKAVRRAIVRAAAELRKQYESNQLQ